MIPPTRKQSGKSSFLLFIPTQLLGVFTAWSIAAGETMVRTLFLGTIAMAMLVPLMIGLEAGLTALIVFEPFRGLLRRAQYIFVPYSSTEPIHVISPIVTICGLIIVMLRHRLAIFTQTPLASLATALALICSLQIFNPLQGGIYIGLTGAMFYIVPMAWFYFAQAADPGFVPRMLRLIVVLGLVASAYGIYQTLVGYPAFELYWIENTDLYESIAVYNVKRALATFSSAEEWGRYIQIAALIAAGLGLSREEGRRRILWFLSSGALMFMIIFTGQRTSIFGLLLGIGILFLTGARSISGIIGRSLLAVVLLTAVIVFAQPVDKDAGYEFDETDRFDTMITHSTKGTIDPMSEGSLAARFSTWGQVLTNDIPSNPLGLGIGAKTASAARSGEREPLAFDNYFLILAVSAGLPAAIILFVILFRATQFCFRGWRWSQPGSQDSAYWRILLALMSTYILNNFFGTSFAIYSVAPIGWLLIGWVSRRYHELEQGISQLNTEY